ncbi:tetratricopeptide repeat protein [Nocardia sp. NPDC059240]|uniref:CHAT domain-containing tetratricopeptide repeat protein n=1 Tax=Nocardia sp. NPDC059240 TaxID=3346786 RepID=UPI0036B8BEC5
MELLLAGLLLVQDVLPTARKSAAASLLCVEGARFEAESRVVDNERARGAGGEPRAALRAAISARLERVTASGDPAPILDPEAVDEGRRLTALLDDTDGDIRSRLVLGWLHWRRYLALPDGLDEPDWRAALTMLTPCFMAGAEPLPEPLLPVLADHARYRAAGQLGRVGASNDVELGTVAIDLWRRILAATPAGHPERAATMAILGEVLWDQYRRAGMLADLEEAVQLCRQAVAAAATDDPNRAATLNTLGNALQTRFGRTGVLADLEESVRVGRQAVAAAPAGHPFRTRYLANLGVALQTRFERTDALADLDEAIQLARQAADGVPADHRDRAATLAGLGNALSRRFERTGALTDLEQAVEVGREALAATRADHSDRGARLANLGAYLHRRFERTGALADLDEAVRLGREAVDATPVRHPARVKYLSNLGNMLRRLFERTGVPADLDEAIQLARQAADATPDDHPKLADRCDSLGALLHRRFERTGALADLDEAIRKGRQAMDATPADHPSRAAKQAGLANTLALRSERTGASADLDEAIVLGRLAVDATPTGNPRRAEYLSNLANMFESRFLRTGASEDLDAAIHRGRRAVEAIPADHPDKAVVLATLANTLKSRFERTGALADLDEAIQKGRQAMDATPADHPSRAAMLSGLANASRIRFERTGTHPDLDEAVQLVRKAVDATPADHPDRAKYLSNLAITLQVRFKRTGTPAELDEAIEKARQAVDATLDDHLSRASYLSNLAAMLQVRFEQAARQTDLDEAMRIARYLAGPTLAEHPGRAAMLVNLGNALRLRYEQTGASSDRDEAIDNFESAVKADTIAPSTRIRIARAAGKLAAESHPARAAGLLASGVRLLPRVALRELTRTDQQYALGGYAGLAADAAAMALSDPTTSEDERPGIALQLLEAGRALLLGQALHLRSDITDLAEEHPQLTDRFLLLRDLLDRTSDSPAADPSTQGFGASVLPEDRLRDRHELAREFEDVLAQIRSYKSTFALPPSLDELHAEASKGPVVVFNVSAYRSDAVLVTSAGISAVALPNLGMDVVLDRVGTFLRALSVTVDGASTLVEQRAAQQQMSGVLEWLWDNAAGPVLDALGYFSPPAPGCSWPRVWWIPGGPLSVLPIHAAGHHADGVDAVRRTVMDRVISSYTPTIAALRHARRPRQAHDVSLRALIVAMPTTPDGPASLHGVSDEVFKVAGHLPDSIVLTEPDPTVPTVTDRLPTKANVLNLLPDCAIAHFACHGTIDAADPSRSQLILHDHASDPLTVAALASIHLDRAQLAYLSACETALAINRRLLDEAITLAAAFQLAGYPNVIGTLWATNDRVSVQIADSFYTALTANDNAVCHPARALHDAIRDIRDEYHGRPSFWAAHLHVGA